MESTTKARLQAAGYTVGDASEFLGLTGAEEALVAMRHNLSRALRAQRLAANLTQAALAKRLGSSQSRIAKMEAGDASVSLDLLIMGLLIAGADRHVVARALCPHDP
jgi:DNA-binding XRE family transcriptional regulator